MDEQQQNRVTHNTQYIKATPNPKIAILDFRVLATIKKCKEIIFFMKKIIG